MRTDEYAGRHGKSAGAAAIVVFVGAVLASLAQSLLSYRPTVSLPTPRNEEDALLGPCTIARERELSCERFVREYLGKQPVILQGHGGTSEALRNTAFAAEAADGTLRRRHGALPVRLSTANAFTGREWTEMSLAEYLDASLGPQARDKHGNETYYLFGSQYGPAWASFLESYVSPASVYPSESLASGATTVGEACDPVRLAGLQSQGVSLSFGVAGRGTGVPFHFHGPGFLQMLHGRKRWFLYPPGAKPQYDPNGTVLAWVSTVYPSLDEPPTHECVLEPGDVIYFPSEWMHATLNVDSYTCFIASFA